MLVAVRSCNCRRLAVDALKFIRPKYFNRCWTPRRFYLTKSILRKADQREVNLVLRARFRLAVFDWRKTSKPHGVLLAVPPWVLLRLAQMGKAAAVLLGRGLRKRYKNMPPGDRDKFHRFLLTVFSGFAGFCVMVYLWNIEEAPITGRRRFVLVSRETVAKMSEEEAEILVSQLAPKILPANHPAYSNVRRVARQLLAQSPVDLGLEPVDWRITIVEGEDVNAFVLPCGWIFIFTGMLEICDNDDRLSAVLAHEIAHCLIGHQQEMASQATLLQLLLFIPLLAIWMVLPTDNVSIISSKVADMVASFFLSLPHSRTMETEADLVGLDLAADACFDVREAAIFWKLMTVRGKTGQEPQVPELLSTHPSHETRVATIENYLPKALDRRAEKGCPLLKTRDMRNIFALINDAAKSSARQDGQIDWGALSRRLQ